MTVKNSNFTRRIIGGTSFLAGHILGSINMNLYNVTTPLLQGSGISNGPNNIGVGGDVNITLESSTVNAIELTSTGVDTSGIKGNANLTVNNSTVEEIIGAGRSDILGNLTISLKNETTVEQLFPTDFATVYGKTSINVDSSTIKDVIYLGSRNSSTIGPVDLTVNNSVIENIICSTGNNRGTLQKATVTINSGSINTLLLGANHGNTISALATVNGGTISKVIVGSTRNGHTNSSSLIVNDGSIIDLQLGSVAIGSTNLATANINGGTVGLIKMGATELGQGPTNVAELNIGGGWIDTIVTGNAGVSVINFTAGNKSFIKNSIDGPNLPDVVNIQKDARTQWGRRNSLFSINTKDFILSGMLLIPHIQQLDLNIERLFIADGGFITPRALTPGNQPIITFIGTPQSTLIINQPLNVNLTFSPNLIGHSLVPFASVTPTFTSPDLFIKENRFGLIWSDLEFDPASSTWFVNNIRPSQDFYAFSVACEATNWLRQQHIWGLQTRSGSILEDEDYGLWVNIQGGYEKLDTSIGSDAKMPWVMATIGYDYLYPLPSIKTKTLYGFAFGVSKGNNKWHSVNTTKNNIELGMISGYLGLIHNSGLYSTLTLQLTSSRIDTKCTGFYKNFKWTETTPTEALELGWKYTFNSGVKINPCGQLIFEQTSKHRFNLPYQDDQATLDKSHLMTTVLGIIGRYTFQLPVPFNIYASIDRIKGQSGNFAIKSQTLQMKFKHDNDTSVIRATLGTDILLGEHLNIHCNIFGDKGNDTGVGGQVEFTYKF